MSAVALHCSRDSPCLEVSFDRRLPRREAEYPGSYCSIPCGAKRYTDYGGAAFGLANNSPAYVFRDLVCHEIFSSCAFMPLFTVGRQVCDLDLPASSTQLKTISWPRPPGF